MHDQEQTSLRTLAGGAAIERFDDEMTRVLENILDQNTDPTKSRKITLEVELMPNHDRTQTAVGIVCKSKICPPAAFPTTLYVCMDADGPKAFENNPRQLTFDDFVKNPDATETELHVTQIRKAQEQ